MAGRGGTPIRTAVASDDLLAPLDALVSTGLTDVGAETLEILIAQNPDRLRSSRRRHQRPVNPFIQMRDIAPGAQAMVNGSLTQGAKIISCRYPFITARGRAGPRWRHRS